MIDVKYLKKDLKRIFLGILPPVNDYQPINSRKEEEIFFPAELMYSKSSKLAQLGTIVNKEIIFPNNTHTLAAPQKFYEKISKELSL